MNKIAIFYHCLFHQDTPDNPLPAAVNIVREQMDMAKASGLLNVAIEFHAGVNGGDESLATASLLLPHNAQIVMHGLQCKNECRTIRMLEGWLPGHEDWYVLYFHSKGATHPHGDGFTGTWRRCMMRHCVTNWRNCVAALDEWCDVAGVHYMEPPATPPGQRIMAGNFWWSKASYLMTLPSIMDRDRIKLSGIDSLESRYESEVWIGNGPIQPKVCDFHGPDWNPSKMASFTA